MDGFIRSLATIAFFLAIAVPARAGHENPHPIARFVSAHPELPAVRLGPGAATDGVLKGADVHRYTLSLRKGDFASIRLRQLEGNLVAAAFDPSGKLIDIVDQNPAGQIETVSLIAKVDGEYAIQTAIYEWDTPRVHYDIQLTTRVAAASSPEAQASQLIDSWYDPALPGAAIAVLRGDKVVLQKTIGLADVEHGVPIRANTRFDLASVSKQFTGLAIAMLVDRGALRLDDDVRRYVPGIPDFGRPILIRHLLAHTSGLRDWDVCLGLTGRNIEDGLTNAQIMSFVSRQRELNFQPGSSQEYSNTGYNVLAEVVARVTGQSFSEWVHHNVLVPAGMTAIANEDAFGTIRDSANSYRELVPVPRLHSSLRTAVAGSSSLHASLNDMIAWARANRNGHPGTAGARSLFGHPGSLDDGTPLEYGFGQWFRERKGIRLVGHLGLAAGFRIALRRYPERDLTFIYMTNDGNDGTFPRSEMIENLFLGIAEEPVAVPDGEFEPRPSRAIADTKPFAGLYYSDELQTMYEIDELDHGLVATHGVTGRITLVPDGADRFQTDRWYMPSVTFVRGSKNSITGFRVTSDGARNILFRRIPE